MSEKKKPAHIIKSIKRSEYAMAAFQEFAELVQTRSLVNGLEIDMNADSVRVSKGAYMHAEPTGIHHYTLRFSVNMHFAPDGTWIENDET